MSVLGGLINSDYAAINRAHLGYEQLTAFDEIQREVRDNEFYNAMWRLEAFLRLLNLNLKLLT